MTPRTGSTPTRRSNEASDHVINIALTVLGLTLLVAGGEGMVRGAVATARRLRISPLVIGLTIVGFGTSAPELVVSVDAALSGSPALSIGNVIGSNVANVLLIVGSAALLSPLAVHPNALRRDALVMLVVTCTVPALAYGGAIGRPQGILMITVLIVYLAWSIWRDRRDSNPTAVLHREEAEEYDMALPQSGAAIALAVLFGLAGLIGGARLAVIGATALARDAGVSEAVIGITLVAVGTSLPELATSLTAARRGQADVCIGNIVGSNLFNILGIAGVSAMAAPLPVRDPLIVSSVWIMIGVTALLMGFMISGARVVRWEGAALLALYAAFIAFQFLAGRAGPPA